MIRQQLEQTLVTAWHTKSPWLVLLRPLSLLFTLLRWLRFTWYHSCTTPVSLKAHTIIVGNISTGGSGKTSMTAVIARILSQHNYSVAIISKGYGRSSKLPQPQVVSSIAPEMYGDEPCMLHQQLGLPIIVCDDRLLALQQWHKKVDILLCDDGMQDYRFQHDCEIALIDGSTGFGNGKLLPEGFLREPIQRLITCQLVLQLAGKQLLPYAQGKFHYTATALRQLKSHHQQNIEQCQQQWQKQEIHAYAGLANNQRFFQFLQQLGFHCHNHPRPDHHNYTASDFTDSPGIKIMTAKDAIKCHTFADETFWYLEVDIKINQTTQTLLRKTLLQHAQPKNDCHPHP